jgi:hypothetical protein
MAMSFTYQLPADAEGRRPPTLEIPVSANPQLLSFDLHPVTDIGGTLVVGFTLVGKGDGRSLHIPETHPGLKVFGCLSHSERADIKGNDGCFANGLFLQVNSSSSLATSVQIRIPFPLAGRWYLILMAQCYDDEEKYGYSLMNSATTCRDESASIKLTVKSDPCLEGGCENAGSCRWFASSGFMFSTCYCYIGK